MEYITYNMKILVISNMYPSDEYKMYGTFVKKTTQAMEQNNELKKIVMTKKKNKIAKLLSYFIFYLKIINFYLLKDYDLVYIHYPSHVSFIFNKLLKLKSQRLIINVHGTDIVAEKGIELAMRKYTERIMKKAEKVVVPSMFFKDYIVKNYNLGESKIYIYPSGGVNSLIFKQPAEIKGKQEIYSYISRIDNGKGWDTYVKAISYIKMSYPKDFKRLTFKIIGSGSKSNVMMKLLEELSLLDDVIIIDSQPQEYLAKIIHESKFVVFPSELKESLGLVGLESLACGTPLISTGSGGISSYLVDEYNGFRFTVGDEIHLANKIISASKLTKENYSKMVESSILTSKDYLDINVDEYLIKTIMEC